MYEGYIMDNTDSTASRYRNIVGNVNTSWSFSPPTEYWQLAKRNAYPEGVLFKCWPENSLCWSKFSWVPVISIGII